MLTMSRIQYRIGSNGLSVIKLECDILLLTVPRKAFSKSLSFVRDVTKGMPFILCIWDDDGCCFMEKMDEVVKDIKVNPLLG